jgi:hypothetical protein
MLGLFVPQLYGAETLVQRLQGKSACLFYLNPSRPILNHNLPTLHAHEVNGFKFPIVSTDLITHYYLTKASFKEKRFYYLRSLDWLKKDDHYENQVGNFTNPDTIYVSSSQWIQEELEKCWGTKSKVIEEIRFEEIYGL